MMLKQSFESMSTESLRQQSRLSNIALNTVWLGAAFALVAAVLKGAVTGLTPGITVLMALLALLASVPVYRQRQKMVQILAGRGR